MTGNHAIPNPNDLFPNPYGTSIVLKNAITPSIQAGEYPSYDDSESPAAS